MSASRLIVGDLRALNGLVRSVPPDALRRHTVVVVDQLEEEARRESAELAEWLDATACVIERTITGIAIAALRRSGDGALLASVLANGSMRAVREYVEYLEPRDGEATVVYEDPQIPDRLVAATVPLTLVRLRLFIEAMKREAQPKPR